RGGVGEARSRPRPPGEPLQDRVGVDLEPPRRAPDTQSLGQAGDDAHDELDRGALTMKNCAKGLQKIAATGDAQQLPPGTATRMPIGAEIPPAHPAAIGTVGVGAEMRGGIHVATAPPCGHDTGWGSRGSLLARGSAVRTGIAGWLGGEARKGFVLTMALWLWGRRL